MILVVVLTCFGLLNTAAAQCGPNEVYSTCSNPCNDCQTRGQCNFLVCNVGCDCREGFHRDVNGNCIPELLCPGGGVETCGLNEVFSNCVNPCNDCYTRGNCNFLVCNKGCDCKQGFYRDGNGNCIPELLCQGGNTGQLPPTDCSGLTNGYEDYYQCVLQCYKDSFDIRAAGSVCSSRLQFMSRAGAKYSSHDVQNCLMCITNICQSKVPNGVCATIQEENIGSASSDVTQSEASAVAEATANTGTASTDDAGDLSDSSDIDGASTTEVGDSEVSAAADATADASDSSTEEAGDTNASSDADMMDTTEAQVSEASETTDAADSAGDFTTGEDEDDSDGDAEAEAEAAAFAEADSLGGEGKGETPSPRGVTPLDDSKTGTTPGDIPSQITPPDENLSTGGDDSGEDSGTALNGGGDDQEDEQDLDGGEIDEANNEQDDSEQNDNNDVSDSDADCDDGENGDAESNADASSFVSSDSSEQQTTTDVGFDCEEYDGAFSGWQFHDGYGYIPNQESFGGGAQNAFDENSDSYRQFLQGGRGGNDQNNFGGNLQYFYGGHQNENDQSFHYNQNFEVGNQQYMKYDQVGGNYQFPSDSQNSEAVLQNKYSYDQGGSDQASADSKIN